MNKELRRKVNLYKYLIERKERRLNALINSNPSTDDDFRQINILLRKISNLEYNTKNLRDCKPINGLADEFNHSSEGHEPIT